jgi:putative DNA primase/helicase
MPDTTPSMLASLKFQAPASDDHDQRRAVASPIALAPRPDIKTTAAAAIPHLERICAHWLPDGKRQGHDWIARNPTRDDQRAGSFAVSLHTGGCIDHATGEQCHDIVSTVRYLDGLPTQGEAAQRVAAFIGAAPVPASTATPIAKAAPKPMPTRPQTHPKLGKISQEWEYRAGDGTLLAVVCRFETAKGKDYRPLTVTPAGWFWRAPPSPRPLYGLDRLAARPEADVILCEGEKAAEAAALLLPATVAMTTMNGARAPALSDWAPLSGRHVRLWPDRDVPGHQYAATAAALAYAAGAESVAMLDLSALGDDLADGWDAADALAEGWTPERIAQMASWIAVAKPSDPPVKTAPLHVPDGWKLTREVPPRFRLPRVT